MRTITKKTLVDRVADKTRMTRPVVKKIIHLFIDEMIEELSQGNRLEFRDFGVFEIRYRAPRVAQNPKTLERVKVSEKRIVKFKVGRLLKSKLAAAPINTMPPVPQPAGSQDKNKESTSP
jgi:integration host factor subunit beta